MMFVFLISLVSASNFIFKKGDSIDLSLPAYDRYKTPLDSASNCEITIKYPNSSIMIASQSMTYENSDKQFHYDIDSKYTSILGEYPVETRCTNTVDYGSAIYSYEITPTGTSLGTGESILYIILTLAFLLLFFLFLYFAIATPYKNETNEKGAVIKITKLKYFKLLFIVLTYLFFILFLNILIGISTNFVSLTIFSGIIGFIFTILINLSYPFGIIILVIAFFEIVRDANIQKQIKRFGGALR